MQFHKQASPFLLNGFRGDDFPSLYRYYEDAKTAFARFFLFYLLDSDTITTSPFLIADQGGDTDLYGWDSFGSADPIPSFVWRR